VTNVSSLHGKFAGRNFATTEAETYFFTVLRGINEGF